MQLILLILLAAIVAALIFLVGHSICHALNDIEREIKYQTILLNEFYKPNDFTTVLMDEFLSLHANDEIKITLVDGSVHYINPKYWYIDRGRFVSKPAKYDGNDHQFMRHTICDIDSISSYQISHQVDFAE